MGKYFGGVDKVRLLVEQSQPLKMWFITTGDT